MATTSFRLPISMPTSMPASPSSSTSSSRFTPRRLKTLTTINAFSSKSKMPMPPFNPNDPFLAKLASVAASSPDTLLNPTSNPDNLPLLDVFESPQLMASSAVARYGYGGSPGSSSPPPDLASLFLDGRIVYIGMPLVSAVTELVVAQIVYLRGRSRREPIYVYINSTGTTRADGETVAFESEGFAIYDALRMTGNEINTVALGAAIGQACLLLASGTRGRRFMMPHAKAMIQQPRVPSTGLRSASDLHIHAKEAVRNRDTLVKLLARHTGHSEETIATKMRRPFYMDALLAKEFGVIDKILWRGQEELKGEIPTREDWDNRTAGAKFRF